MSERHNVNERLRKLSLINEAGNALHSIVDIDELLEKILSSVEQVFCLNNCAILIRDPETNELFIWKERGYDPQVVKTFRAKQGQGVTGWVMKTGKPALIDDVRQDSRYIPGVRGGQSEMAVPLRIGQSIIGVLDAESEKSNCFSEEDLELFAIFASQAATAIQHVRIYSDLVQQMEKLKRKSIGLTWGKMLASLIARAKTVESAIQEMVSLLYYEIKFTSCGVFQSINGKEFKILVGHGYPKSPKSKFRLPKNEDFISQAIQEGGPMMRRLDGTIPHLDSTLELGWEMAAPLTAMGRLVGIIDLRISEPSSFEPRDMALVETITSPIALCLLLARKNDDQIDE